MDKILKISEVLTPEIKLVKSINLSGSLSDFIKQPPKAPKKIRLPSLEFSQDMLWRGALQRNSE